MPIPGTDLSTALISDEIEIEFGNKQIAKITDLTLAGGSDRR
jgi:hypothetical protein